MTPAARVSLRRRLAALVALAGTLVLAATVIVILFRHGDSLVVGIAGLFLVVAGGWWLVTEPMPRRAFGIAGFVAGVALLAVAIANALGDAERVVSRSVLIAVLLAITLACARAAMVRDLRRIDIPVRAGGAPQRKTRLR